MCAVAAPDMSRRKQARPIRVQDECGPNGLLCTKNQSLAMLFVGKDETPLLLKCATEQTHNESGKYQPFDLPRMLSRQFSLRFYKDTICYVQNLRLKFIDLLEICTRIMY